VNPAAPGSIDFHTHVIPRRLPHGPYDGCPALVVEPDGTGNVLRDGKLYRVVDERVWDVERRIADMDARAIELQVLSPMPVYYAYDAPSHAARDFARAQNENIAAIVRARSDRFAGLGTVPLQDPGVACDELAYAVRDLGLRGIEVGTAAAGRDLDDPALEPFWALCAETNAIVFVHPEAAPGFERLGKARLIVSAGYPSETGLAAAKLLMSGIFARHPNLRVVLAHGGGTLPWLLPRLDRLWSMFDDVRAVCADRPSASARAFYCDTLTFDAENLRLVAERIGSSHLMVGSDYPFAVMERPAGRGTRGLPGVRCEVPGGDARRERAPSAVRANRHHAIAVRSFGEEMPISAR
jgi:aminocarboxymuconate-semialdehyde decarboxylase